MPGHREVYEQALRQGNSAAWDQKWDQAITAYQRALTEFPGDPVAMDHLGLAFMQSGQLDQAQAVYQEAVRADPQNPIPHEKIAEILERNGKVVESVQLRLSAAELFLAKREADKAIDNWLAAARLVPENMVARSRLALAFERTGQHKQAVTEYLALAAIMQRARQPEKAMQAIEQGIRIIPDSPELARARSALKSGKVLAIPPPYKPGMTGMLVPQTASLPPEPPPPSPRQTASVEPRSTSPQDAAQKKAMAVLAEKLFEADRDTFDQRRTSIDQFTRGEEKAVSAHADQNRYLALAIDAYSRQQQQEAMEYFDRAFRVGFEHPAASFLFGTLQLAEEQLEQGMLSLQKAVEHPDLSMGAHYILGRACRDAGQAYRSAIHFLSALRLADMNTVPDDQRDALQRTYEAFLEVPESEQEPDQWNQTGERIEALLTSPDWESRLRLARAQLDAQSDSPGTAPLAEMLSLGKPQALIEAMGYLDLAVRRGLWRTAMEQAMLALDHGPTYLPLHLRITEIQLKEDKQTEALAKLGLIARTYRIRGETLQAAKIYERILQINPMDVGSRTELINLLVQQGDLRSALSFYLDLADVYTQLADLEGARQTYESALMLAIRNNADKSWQIQLLYRLGDLYMQRLDYRAALQTFQRLQQLDPTDEKAGTQLVDLMIRLGKIGDAQNLINNVSREWTRLGRQDQVLEWLEELVRVRPEEALLRRKLADTYQQRGRIAEAIGQLDALGDAQVEAGNIPDAILTVRAILALRPPNAEGYQELLQKLESGSVT
ncbi:MAG: tetratricopeptide repeat protein [Anaerolineales bacterium]|nr:tetratricopeptide repeat protein [Anaerolineales bacterium]